MKFLFSNDTLQVCFNPKDYRIGVYYDKYHRVFSVHFFPTLYLRYCRRQDKKKIGDWIF